jgi:hypothetical protein
MVEPNTLHIYCGLIWQIFFFFILVELEKIVTSSNNYLVKFLRKSQVVIHIKEKKNQCFRKFSIERKEIRKNNR